MRSGPWALQRLVLKDYEGKDIGAVTFKVIPVDPDSAPGSGGGGAAAGRLQPASPTTAEIKLLESEIFAVRHECAQHRVQNEARVRTLKSRLEGTVNFDAPHSSSEEAIVHLRSLHQELTHLELELSENRTDRVEKAERQTQEVLQLLEESKAAYGSFLPGFGGVPSEKVALAYVRSALGGLSGHVLEVDDPYTAKSV